LEEAILGVDEAGGSGNVLTRGAPDRRDAERVARDHDGRREPIQPELTSERRKTSSKLGPHPDDARSGAYGQQDRDREPYYPQSTTHRDD
jgi:hypothetical protein